MDREWIYRQVGRDGYYKTWHKLDNNMFLLVHAGEGSIVLEDSVCPMKRGTLCFMGQNKYHYTFPERVEDYVRSKVFVSPEELEKLSELLCDDGIFAQSFTDQAFAIGELDAADLGRAEELLYRLTQVGEKAAHRSAERLSVILQLIVLVSRNMTYRKTKSLGPIPRVIEYINSHATEPLDHEQLCGISYMSKYHFCRRFKEQTGLTVMEYVLKTRIMLAEEMLAVGNASVSTVSEHCGFSSISYFSRVFKQETGMTPMQYKQKKQKNKPL